MSSYPHPSYAEKVKQKQYTHRRKDVLRDGCWTYKQVFAYFRSYFKTIIKIADPGWIFHVGWGGWELWPAGSSSAFLPFKRDVVVCCGRNQRYGVMSVLTESRAPCHAHLLVNISCPTPIRAAEDFNVCLHICSPLLYPGCSNNDLLFKQKEKIQSSHIGLLIVMFWRRKLFLPLVWWIQLLQNNHEIPANTYWR